MLLLIVSVQSCLDPVGRSSAGYLSHMAPKSIVQRLRCHAHILGLASSTFDYIDDIPSFAVNCVFNLEVAVSTFRGAFNIRLGIKSFTSQAVIVTFSD